MVSARFFTAWLALPSMPKRWKNRRATMRSISRLSRPPRSRVTGSAGLPGAARAAQCKEKYGAIVDEGVADLQKAMELRPDYDDAMAYLNLLYRQKADMEATPEARDADIKLADELVNKVKAIKQRKMDNPEPSS